MDSYLVEPFGLSKKRLKSSIRSGTGHLDFQLPPDPALSMSDNPPGYPVSMSSGGTPLHFDSQSSGVLPMMPAYGYTNHSSLEALGSAATLPPRAVSVSALNSSTWSQTFMPTHTSSTTAPAPSTSYPSNMIRAWPSNSPQDPDPQQAAQVLAAMAATSLPDSEQYKLDNGNSIPDIPAVPEDLHTTPLMQFQEIQEQEASWASFTNPYTAKVIFPCVTECDEDDCSSVCSEPDYCEPGCIDTCNVGTVCSDPCLDTLCEDVTCVEGVTVSKQKDSYLTASTEANLNGGLSHLANSQCLWVSDNGYCRTMLPSPGALVQHVFKDHIEPQTAQLCPYECGATIDRGEIIQHMSREHAYMCFEYGCDFQSTDYEHLSQHVKTAHSRSRNAECHWDECSVTAVDSYELNGHVVAEHLTIPSCLTEVAAPPSIVSSPAKVSELVPIAREGDESFHSPITNPKPVSSIALPTPSSNDGKKVCCWITHDNPTDICGMAFDKPNDLQDHVEKTHVQPLMGPEAKLCQWKECNRGAECSVCKKEYANNDTLKAHMRTHTNEKAFKCETCNKSFNNNGSLSKKLLNLFLVYSILLRGHHGNFTADSKSSHPHQSHPYERETPQVRSVRSGICRCKQPISPSCLPASNR
ncbi:MAG: hypothetical protein Q9187_001712 [Circinaria calcarea]